MGFIVVLIRNSSFIICTLSSTPRIPPAPFPQKFTPNSFFRPPPPPHSSFMNYPLAFFSQNLPLLPSSLRIPLTLPSEIYPHTLLLEFAFPLLFSQNLPSLYILTSEFPFALFYEDHSTPFSPKSLLPQIFYPHTLSLPLSLCKFFF